MSRCNSELCECISGQIDAFVLQQKLSARIREGTFCAINTPATEVIVRRIEVT